MNKKGISIIQSVPPCLLERKKGIVRKMEELRKLNRKLRYQIRLGEDDFKVLVKRHSDVEYTRYKPMEMDILDPLAELPVPNKNYKPQINESN